MALYFHTKDKQKWKNDFKGGFLTWKNNFFGEAIGFFARTNVKVVSKACNKKGRILILDVLKATNFLLISFYNSNSKPDQLYTLSTLYELLEK